MKNLLNVFFLLSLIILSSGFTTDKNPPSTAPEIEWITWAEAVRRNAIEPRKIFVDVYTDWCGYCKQMDTTTFKNKAVVDIVNKNFYAVKLDAEQKEDIIFQRNRFKFVQGAKRKGNNGYHKGSHQLAAALLDGRMAYPSFVILDEEFARIMLSPGFKQAQQIMTELSFAKDEQYKVMSWDQYRTQPKARKSKTSR